MNCEEALLLISAALDGELNETEHQALNEHLSTCADCRALSEDMGVLSVALSDMAVVPPDTLIEQVNATLDAMDTTAVPDKKVHAFPRYRKWISLAATFAVVVCLGSLFCILSEHDSPVLQNTVTASASDPSKENTADSNTHLDRVRESNDLLSVAAEGGQESEQALTATEPEQLPQETMNFEMTAQDQAQVQMQNQNVGGMMTGSDTSAGSDTLSAEVSPSPTPEEPVVGEISSVEQNAAKTETVNSVELTQVETLTPIQAAEQLFAYLGGHETYPEAVFDAANVTYILLETSTEKHHIALRLDYEGLSDTGDFFTFRQYEYIIQNGADGWAYTVTANRFSLSLDGSELIAEHTLDPQPVQPEDSEDPEDPEDSEAFVQPEESEQPLDDTVMPEEPVKNETGSEETPETSTAPDESVEILPEESTENSDMDAVQIPLDAS